jgi:hypothetical protein
MARQQTRTGRAIVAGGVLLLALIFVAAIVFRSPDREDAGARPMAPPPQTDTPPPAPQPPIPVAAPVLTRGDLIAAAGVAASAYAGGAPPAAENRALVGRRFRLRIPFGCTGPLAPEEERSAFWSFGPERKTIRISVRPENWLDTALARELGGEETFDAVEGFWIPRPWLASEDCPARRGDPLQTGPAPASPETVGLATFYDKGGSRLEQRRDRPYETVVPVPETGEAPVPEGFRLILEGRIVGYPDGRAFRCLSAGENQRPVCVAGVQVETVAVEDPVAETVVAEWRR